MATKQIAVSDVIPSEEDQKRIIKYLTGEVYDVEGNAARAELIERVDKWRRQREAIPAEKFKNFPWENASNVEPPLAMINTNGIYSKYRMSMTMRNPLWKIKTFQSNLNRIDQAKALEGFIDALAESKYHMNMRRTLRTLLYDTVSLGNQAVKVPWMVDKRKYGVGEGARVITRVNSPRVIPMRFEDYMTRSFWANSQDAPWVGHRIYLFEHELLQRENAGIYYNIDQVLRRGDDEPDENYIRELERTGVYPNVASTEMYKIFETFLFYDVDGDGEMEDIKVWFDPVTQTILRAEFNDLGIRDWTNLRYFERPHQLYAIGIGWIMEQLQDEAYTLHNMRINGTLLSMLQMYVTKRGGGIPPGERFRPLKNIQVDDPSKDFLPIKFPDIGYGTLQAEMMTKQYADRATTLSDYAIGFENQAIGTRSTFAGTQFLAGQNQAIMEGNMEGFEDDFAQIGQILLYQCVRNKDEAMAIAEKIMDEKDLPLLEQALSIPLEELPESFSFYTNTTEINESEESRRQNMLSLTALYMQYGQQMIQLLQARNRFSQEGLLDPETDYVIKKLYVGATEMMSDVVEQLGNDDPERFVPYVDNFKMINEAMDKLRENQAILLGRMQHVRENERTMGAAEGAGGPAGEAAGAEGRGTALGNAEVLGGTIPEIATEGE